MQNLKEKTEEQLYEDLSKIHKAQNFYRRYNTAGITEATQQLKNLADLYQSEINERNFNNNLKQLELEEAKKKSVASKNTTDFIEF